MSNKLQRQTFIIGLVAALVIYFSSKLMVAPAIIFILIIGVIVYQYVYIS